MRFFFSSRRRHTRFSRDWSSDVCSSDLVVAGSSPVGHPKLIFDLRWAMSPPPKSKIHRSEERRVGKECRSRTTLNNQNRLHRFPYTRHDGLPRSDGAVLQVFP